MSWMEQRTYETTLPSGRTVGYYVATLPPEDAERDYMAVIIPSDGMSSYALMRRGFCFGGRSISLEIPLGRFRPAIAPGKKFRTMVGENWQKEEIFGLAKNTFDKDERFALDLAQTDTELKNELLHGYLGELKRQGALATLFYEGSSLEGFNLWLPNGADARIVLGALSARYRGTGLALTLYSHTLCAMKERGVEWLCDIIDSANTASLNLHAMLIKSAGGAFRFGPCRDHYKKERPHESDETGE